MFTLKTFMIACIMNLPPSATLNIPNRCMTSETLHLEQSACAARVTELVVDKTVHAICIRE